MIPEPRTTRSTDIFRIVLVYALFASLWILFSDQLLAVLVADRDIVASLATGKGLLFVAVTSILLYLLMRRLLATRLEASADEAQAWLFGWPRWHFYVLAIALAAASIWLRMEIAVHFGNRPLLIMMVLPIILVAALGGFGPGLLATALVAGAAVWFIPPHGKFSIAAGHDIIQWSMLIAVGLLISLMSEILHRSRRQEHQRWRQLEASQTALRDSEERFRTMFENAPVAMGLVGADGAILSQNVRFEQLFGYTIDDMPTIAAWWSLACPDPAYRTTALARWNAAVEHAAETGGEIDAGEYRMRCKDGSERVVRIKGIVLTEGMLSSFLDITEQRRAEQALIEAQAEELRRRDEARLAALNQMEDANVARRAAETAAVEQQALNQRITNLLEGMSDGFVSLDRQWRYRYVNRKAGELLGRDPASLIGKHIWTEFPEGIGQPFRQAYEEAMNDGIESRLEEYYAPWNRWFENRIYPTPDGLAIFFTDISERIRSMQALRDSEERLRLALTAAKQGLYDLDLTTGDAKVSPEYATMLGYDPATFKETNAAWRERLHPDDQASVYKAYEDYIAGRIPEYRVEFRQRTRDGGWKWVLSLGRIQDWSADGRPLRMLGTHTDIDALKAAEAALRDLNETLEARVEQRTAELTAANQELESFAYAVSHDLRAPLRAMSGFSVALQEDFGATLTGDAKQYLDQIDLASRKMSDLIDGLLTLSRSTRGELCHDPVDLSAMALRRLDRLAHNEPQRQVTADVEPGLHAVGDARMLEVVIGNLIDNAWKYTAGIVPAQIRVHAGTIHGVRGFCVSDNGAGFDMAHAARLFKPFQRLHRQEEFPGTGIGLATVQRVIHRHGGEIVARGKPGEGASFCFTLPASGVEKP